MSKEVLADLPSSIEMRKNSRHPLKLEAKMLGHDAIPHVAKITDISRGGIGLQSQEVLQTGDTCAISFDANIHGEKKRINIWAKVAYCTQLTSKDFQIGVQFRDYDTHSRTYIKELCDPSALLSGW